MAHGGGGKAPRASDDEAWKGRSMATLQRLMGQIFTCCTVLAWTLACAEQAQGTSNTDKLSQVSGELRCGYGRH